MLHAPMDGIVTHELELGFLAQRESALQPGVVVIHDVWGLSDHTRDLARRLARDGFDALAVNLYHRERTVKISDPGAWIRALDDRQVLADVQAAVDLLAHGGRRVGVVGFCMGGSYAILAAAACRGLAAAVPFYGMLSDEHGLLAPLAGATVDRTRKPRAPLAAAAALRCPTLAFFGEQDAFIPVADVRAFQAQLAPEHRVVLVAGAGHAFMNDTRPELFRPDAASDAWARMLDWLRRHLTG